MISVQTYSAPLITLENKRLRLVIIKAFGRSDKSISFSTITVSPPPKKQKAKAKTREIEAIIFTRIYFLKYRLSLTIPRFSDTHKHTKTKTKQQKQNNKKQTNIDKDKKKKQRRKVTCITEINFILPIYHWHIVRAKYPPVFFSAEHNVIFLYLWLVCRRVACFQNAVTWSNWNAANLLPVDLQRLIINLYENNYNVLLSISWVPCRLPIMLLTCRVVNKFNIGIGHIYESNLE